MDPYILCILFALCSLTNARKLLRVSFSSSTDAEAFQKFTDEHNMDVWMMQPDCSDVVVSDSQEDLVKSKFEAEVRIADLDKVIEKDMAENERAGQRARRMRSGAAPTENFASYHEIIAWLEKIARDYKSFVSLLSIGKTYEGREMKVLRIGTGPEIKPAVFITSGLHAREWLSTATMIYAIDKIIKKKLANDPRITKLIQKYDWYFSVVSNPDGYVYTFKDKRTRLWRKTRRPQAYGCIGADANRNFDVDFGRKASSKNPCSQIYPGPHPFSENCIANLRDFTLSPCIKGRIKLYYDVHAFGQLYFVPYAFNKTLTPPDDEELRRVAKISNDALRKVNGRDFKIGTVGSFFYEASGSTMDWFKLKGEAKYTYGLEVYPARGNRKAFNAKPKDIAPSGKEILEAILTAAENIKV